jgi:hypothetical protein
MGSLGTRGLIHGRSILADDPPKRKKMENTTPH